MPKYLNIPTEDWMKLKAQLAEAKRQRDELLEVVGVVLKKDVAFLLAGTIGGTCIPESIEYQRSIASAAQTAAHIENELRSADA
ncbi:hypothetical protein Dalk_4595 [Desulfatibacillum aliphaticivorans]|uniref:Uncharacterized protein n=1 Tax=Desulfatibacillum aliphaticivorans TaxID=218208 RepID=B8FNJ2_DESAL|nr:hypothetical protein [Desulfatibacillum aliphaticivorans]ACL06273.1 hypothetical protein Dalk_4595 [Desulfatibacillum aliphaticivorans]